jgi:hypothetical protein
MLFSFLRIPADPMKLSPSSLLTVMKKSQAQQLDSFVANVPWTLLPHSVPVKAQQERPPFLPPFTPSHLVSVEALHNPSSATFTPPGSLAHFLNSQQFCFIVFFTEVLFKK